MFFPLQPPFSLQGDSVNVVGWISHTSLIGWLSCAYNITGFQSRLCITSCRSKTTSKWYFYRVAVTVFTSICSSARLFAVVLLAGCFDVCSLLLIKYCKKNKQTVFLCLFCPPRTQNPPEFISL